MAPMDHIKNFLRGLLDGLTIMPPRRGYRVERRGFAVDAANLRHDATAVGEDMRTILKCDQQALSAKRPPHHR